MSGFYSHTHRHSHGYDTEHRHQHQHARKNWHRAIAREGGGEFAPQHKHDHTGDYGVAAPAPEHKTQRRLSQKEAAAVNAFITLSEDGYVDAGEVAEELGCAVVDVLRMDLPYVGHIKFRRKVKQDEPSSE